MQKENSFFTYPNVVIGTNASLAHFVIIGEPPVGRKEGELITRIGENAIIRSHTVIYAGNIIGDDFQTGHGVLVREENHIGNGVSIGSHTVIEHNVVIEDGVRIHSQVFIPEFTILKEQCWVGPNVVFTNARYPLSHGVKKSLKGPIIGSHAIIGANATLLPGIVVGSGALIGAGSVVVGDVSDGAVVVGNPAKTIKKLAELDAYSTNIRIE